MPQDAKVSVLAIIWDLKAVCKLQILAELQSKEAIASVIFFPYHSEDTFLLIFLAIEVIEARIRKPLISPNLPRWQAIYYKVLISF